MYPEAAENLAVGEMVAGAGAAESCEQGCGYKEDFLAAVQNVWGLVKYSCVYDCFFVFADKVVYPFCDDWVDY